LHKLQGRRGKFEILKTDEEFKTEGDIRPFILIIVLSVFFDQASKALALIFLIPSRSVPLIGEYVRFTLILNRGAAFGISLGSYSHLILLVISLVAIVFIVFYYLRSSARHGWKRFAFGLIAGGAIGNMIDRLAKKEVVDFIDCGIGDLRWPIFNIADIAVTLGVLLLLKYSFSQPSQNPSLE